MNCFERVIVFFCCLEPDCKIAEAIDYHSTITVSHSYGEVSQNEALLHEKNEIFILLISIFRREFAHLRYSRVIIKEVSQFLYCACETVRTHLLKIGRELVDTIKPTIVDEEGYNKSIEDSVKKILTCPEILTFVLSELQMFLEFLSRSSIHLAMEIASLASPRCVENSIARTCICR